jgi:ubiquinone/menaquinone biosynthesis C-methylase UbiE
MSAALALDPLYDAAYTDRRGRGLAWYQRWMARDRVRRMRRYGGLGAGDEVLEVGCDRGVLLREIDRTAAVAHGIDINADAVRESGHPRARTGSATAIPHAAASFHVAVAAHVIEHLPEPRVFLAELARVVRPGGTIFLWYPFELFRGMTVLPELVVGRKPLGLARAYHLHTFTPRRLARLLHVLPLRPMLSEWCVYGPVPEFLTVLRRVP